MLLGAAIVSSCAVEPSASSSRAEPITSASVAEASSPAASPTAAPTPEQASQSPIAWSEVPLHGLITDVVADRAGFVAVGIGGSGASSWLSPDGTSWDELDVPDNLVLESDEMVPDLFAAMGEAVRLGDTLYSFGGNSFMDAYLGGGWRWTDGQSWQVIESTSNFFGMRVEELTVSEDALLASGVAFGGPKGNWMTWRWTPATSWVKTPLSNTAEDTIAATSLAWRAGTFVAAGFAERMDTGDGGLPPTNMMWTSPDGMTWTSVPIPDNETTICALAAVPAGGFVAIGRRAAHVTAWKSADGTRWELANIEPRELTELNPQASCAVVPIGDRLLALVADAPRTTHAWTSRDGGEWAASDDLEITLSSAAGFGDQVVVVGGRGTLEEPEQVVMRGQLDN